MYVFTPVNLIAAPLVLWFAACIAWTFLPGTRAARASHSSGRDRRIRRPFRRRPGAFAVASRGQRLQGRVLRAPAARGEKGLRELVALRLPRGLHDLLSALRPGLSDNAGFNLPEMPANAYMGLYIDSDGPIGVMRHLADKETAYFRYLPMYLPYVIKKAPKTFITQFGGGISTEVALRSGAKASPSPRATAPSSPRSAIPCSRISLATF